MPALVVYAYPDFDDSSLKITCQKELSSHFNKISLHLNFVFSVEILMIKCSNLSE